jgi:hypothetical protein
MKRRPAKSLFILTLIGISIIIFTFSAWLFRVKSFTCQLQNDERCPAGLDEQLTVVFGRSLFFTDFNSLLANLNLSGQSFTVTKLRKRLPSSLELILLPEPFFYILRNANSDEKIAVTAAGMISNSPVIDEQLELVEVYLKDSIWQEIVDNNQVESFHQPLSVLLTSLKNNELYFSKIEWQDPSEIRVFTKDKIVIIFDNSLSSTQIKQAKELLSSSELSTLDMEPTELDMRFRLPVLRTH